jgi:hypothetical protein
MKLFSLLASLSVAVAGPCVLANNNTQRVSDYVAAVNQHMRDTRMTTLIDTPIGTGPGPYKAKFDRIRKIPGLTQGGKTSAVIIYPEEALDANGNPTGATFPFLSFAHATFIGGTFPATDIAYKTLMNTVVSYGFIVVAPETCSAKECASAFAKDQIATLDACKSDPSLHPALASASFDKVGVFGHSMGAMATIASAGGSSLGIRPADHNIAAAVSMHPCRDIYELPGKVSVPIMFTTGSADTICADGCAESFYGSVKGDKVLLNVKGANHFDPTSTGQNREDEAIALFFACWLRGEQCDAVYGPGGQAICGQVTRGAASECKVSGTPTDTNRNANTNAGPLHGSRVNATCTDVAPDSKHSCAQQKAWGKCSQSFMKGHCCKTCFNCQCGAGPTPPRPPAPGPQPSCTDVAPDSKYSCAFWIQFHILVSSGGFLMHFQPKPYS